MVYDAKVINICKHDCPLLDEFSQFGQGRVVFDWRKSLQPTERPFPVIRHFFLNVDFSEEFVGLWISSLMKPHMYSVYGGSIWARFVTRAKSPPIKSILIRFSQFCALMASGPSRPRNAN